MAGRAGEPRGCRREWRARWLVSRPPRGSHRHHRRAEAGMSLRHQWRDRVSEAARLAVDSLRTHRARSGLAIVGIVIGLVTVVLVASVLANVRNQVALLFRDLGTENVFAFHLTGDPYAVASELEARRLPLKLEFVADVRRLSTAAADVG